MSGPSPDETSSGGGPPRVAYLPPEDDARIAAAAAKAQAREDEDGVQRTHPLSFLIGALGGLTNAFLPIAAVFYSQRGEQYVVPLALGIGVAIIAASSLVQYLRWRKRTYLIGDTDIRVESGIVSRAARSVPYERIQDVSLEQKLLPRLFGLVEVRFETGAGGGDELKLAYLTEAEGERLREVVRDRKEAGEASVSETDDEEGLDGGNVAAAAEPATEIFSMSPKRVLTFGLFEFSLAIVAVLGGLAQQFDFLLPFDIWDWREWSAMLGGPGDDLAQLGPTMQIIGIVAAIGSLIVVGIVTGLVRTASREWGFVLERTAKGFRRRRGLFTRTDVVMPVHRVQALVIGTKWLRRRFGWHSLKFVSLAQDSSAANHVVAPFAQMAELEPIIRAAGFSTDSGEVDWHRAAPASRLAGAVIDMAAFVVLAAAMAIGFSFVDEVSSLWAFALLGFGAVVTAAGWWAWRYRRHALDGAQIYSRKGWLAPQTKVATRVKLHSAEIAQGPIGRWGGYATLHLGLAGGSLAFAGLPLERAQTLRAAVLESVAATDFSQLDTAA